MAQLDILTQHWRGGRVIVQTEDYAEQHQLCGKRRLWCYSVAVTEYTE